ncbi:Os04g0153475 [Oryza sativa Japonica Group]|uniref:Os04g0153475 protein n=1 Tax=Oryza sativa subsp. japonica TaxID=39947 RepID=A0A0P0W6L6_ORYSJ|nr:Os04g0153475 [Oryza sativa Japonica Group]
MTSIPLTSRLLSSLPALAFAHLRAHTVLEGTHNKHQDKTATSRLMIAVAGHNDGGRGLVEDVPGCRDLHRKTLQVVHPQPVVLHGVGRDGVLPTKVEQQERRPECHQLLLWQPAVEGHVSQGVHGHRVGRHGTLPRPPPSALQSLLDAGTPPG